MSVSKCKQAAFLGPEFYALVWEGLFGFAFLFAHAGIGLLLGVLKCYYNVPSFGYQAFLCVCARALGCAYSGYGVYVLISDWGVSRIQRGSQGVVDAILSWVT